MYTFKEFKDLSSDQQFEFFIDNLAKSNKNPTYFVNWEKVYNNVRDLGIALNTVNYLLGKEDIEYEAKHLFEKQPALLKVIPFLIASRDKEYTLLTNVKITIDEELRYLYLDFKNIDETKLDEYILFMREVGLLSLLSKGGIKNLEDYVLGVEVGLDSNGRKNRGGHIAENIINKTIEDSIVSDKYSYLVEANSIQIELETGIKVPVDKSDRRFDFVIFDKVNEHITLIEVNFYNGGGSKLKSVAGEFRNQHKILERNQMNNVSFVWITDGPGWLTSRRPLQEAYQEVDHILNMKMISMGFLHEIINQNDGKQF